MPRRPTVTVAIGAVRVGSCHPIVVQSMTNTDTEDAASTAIQVEALAAAGSELVRITVNTRAAARAASAIPRISHPIMVPLVPRRRPAAPRE